MKVRPRLTILFTIITATILLLFALVIYLDAKNNREKDFYTSLKKEAITKANLFFNANVEAGTLQNIYRSNRKILNEVEVAIYDTSFHLLYHDAVDIDVVKETKQMIDEIYQKGEIKFYQQDWQVIGLKYPFQNKNYIITAAAYDQYGYSKLNNLLKSSVVVFIISILFIYIAGRFFSKKAFEPVKEMLNRLENSFDAQKQFVSNISHELRTPLAVIISELELATYKERSIQEYKEVIVLALQDAKRLARLANGLLDFAKANYDQTEITFKEVRLDEVLLDARQQVIKSNPGYKIQIEFTDEEAEDDGYISVNGNEYLLKVAFVNLMENGCKFSPDNTCTVIISHQHPLAVLQFVDNGIGISTVDLPNIFTPFYRGSNKQYTDGHGIGLSLTQKIIKLHKGNIAVE